MFDSPQCTRANKFARSFNPAVLDHFESTRAPWHETPAEIRLGIEQGRRRAILLTWVRVQMQLRLTRREAECIDLYFFKGMTYKQAGRATETEASSVWRAVQRGLRKLRLARDEDDSWHTAITRLER